MRGTRRRQPFEASAARKARKAAVRAAPARREGAYAPWYSARFNGARAVADYLDAHHERLKRDSERFRDAFYRSTLPPEVMEAVAANLTIFKSPTLLRQPEGRIWAWEGSWDNEGCCGGSCTHVWNYAQAMPHLFPDLERGLRQTEFCDNQDHEGQQEFRANIPIERDRFDGRRRNPFDEYEYGHWYARALASYGLIQGLTGIRYDAVDKTLYIDSKIGDDFTSFLATASGFGVAGLKNGKPFVSMSKGGLHVDRVLVSGREMELAKA